MRRYGFSAESVVVLYRSELISAKTALRELGLEEFDSSFLGHLMDRPAIQAIETTGDRELDLLVRLVESQLLSRRTAMGRLGIEDPKREAEDIFLERMLQRPDVQAFTIQLANAIAPTRRQQYPWRYRT